MSESKKRVPKVEVQSLYDSSEMLVLDEELLDPTRHYRFVHEGQQRQARLRAAGYTPVLRSDVDGELLQLDEKGGSAEDLIRVGDTILMSCPKDRHESRRNQIEEMTKARLSVPEGQFRRKAQSRAVNVTDKSMKGED
jgi:hypothetical protein